MQALCDASHKLPSVNHLSLSGSGIGVKGMRAFSTVLIQGGFESLRYLDLGENPFEDGGVIALADAVLKGKLRSLEHLGLTSVGMKQFGFDALMEAVEETSLPASREFTYNGNGVTSLRSLGRAMVSGMPSHNMRDAILREAHVLMESEM